MTDLKSLSDNSNISLLASVVSLQARDNVLVLGIMNDFLLYPGPFGYYKRRFKVLFKSLEGRSLCLDVAHGAWTTLVGCSSDDNLIFRDCNALFILLLFLFLREKEMQSQRE